MPTDDPRLTSLTSQEYADAVAQHSQADARTSSLQDHRLLTKEERAAMREASPEFKDSDALLAHADAMDGLLAQRDADCVALLKALQSLLAFPMPVPQRAAAELAATKLLHAPHPGQALLAERDELRERVKALEQEVTRLRLDTNNLLSILDGHLELNDESLDDEDAAIVFQTQAALAESAKPAKEKP